MALSGYLITLGGAGLLLLLAYQDGRWELAVLAMITVGFTLLLSDLRDTMEDIRWRPPRDAA